MSLVSTALLGIGLLAGDVGLDEMRRAVDRAFTTELAGDFAGAEAGIRGLARTSTLTGSAQIRADTYLSGLAARRTAFERHGRTSAGFAAAFATLREAPERWSALLWDQAREAIPDLDQAEPSRVRVRTRRIEGRDAEEVARFVASQLRQRGVAVSDAAAPHRAELELRLDLDAADVQEDRTRHRARAEGTYVLRATEPPGAVVGSGAQSHEARRATVEAARRWASRKVLDALVDDVAFDVRLRWLTSAAAAVAERQPD